MSYSRRQQHCLEAMGIVPWVSRVAVPVEPLQATLAEQFPLEPVGQYTVSDAPEPAAVTDELTVVSANGAAPWQVPAAFTQLLSWLPEQTIEPFHIHGQVRHVFGPDAAPLLVVVEARKGVNMSAPFDADAAKLFELMMAAISLNRNQCRTCLLAGSSLTSIVAGSLPAATVASVCSPLTRAILLLSHDWDVEGSLQGVEPHQGVLEAPALTVVRIPHPMVLLEHSQLKRQAWHSLQFLQSQLL